MGVLTATFGGVIRDVLAHEPSVLLRQIYVTPALRGAAVFVVLHWPEPAAWSAGAAGFAIAFLVRAGAILWGWSLPGFPGRGRDRGVGLTFRRPGLGVRVVTRFMALEGHVRQMSKPTVAAVSGHAFAGGAILALACDFRVMAAGEFSFAINEVNLGIVLPTVWTRRIERALGTATRQLLLGGKPLSPEARPSAGHRQRVDGRPRRSAIARSSWRRG